MGHLVLYNAKDLVSNRSLVFWTLAFPILLGILFKVALGDIVNKEAFDTVPVAVVNSQVYKDSAFKIAFDELMKAGDTSVTGSDKPFCRERKYPAWRQGKSYSRMKQSMESLRLPAPLVRVWSKTPRRN